MSVPGKQVYWRCVHCGYTFGAHKAATHRCPLSERIYKPEPHGPMKEFNCDVDGVNVIGKANEMADGNYYASASIAGGLTYGFVLMRKGTTKTPKYVCTQAMRLAPRTNTIMKGETPVEILALPLPIEGAFAHVIEALVEFSKDDENINTETRAARKLPAKRTR